MGTCVVTMGMVASVIYVVTVDVGEAAVGVAAGEAVEIAAVDVSGVET